MLDKSNRPADIQQMAEDRIHWFFSLDYAGRRQYSEDTATNVYYEQMATHWGNWAKLFFNNQAVLQQQGRRRALDRPLRPVPAQRSERLGRAVRGAASPRAIRGRRAESVRPVSATI
jgi:hypothetical protein